MLARIWTIIRLLVIGFMSQRANGFKTATCSHEELLIAEEARLSCVAGIEIATSIRGNVCPFFRDFLNCTDTNLAQCLAKEDLKNYKTSQISVLLKLMTLDGGREEAFDHCRVIAKYKRRVLHSAVTAQTVQIGLMFYSSDKHCDKPRLHQLTEQLRLCRLKLKGEMDTDIRVNLIDDKPAQTPALCQYLNRYMSECFDTTFGGCYSDREKRFAREIGFGNMKSYFGLFEAPGTTADPDDCGAAAATSSLVAAAAPTQILPHLMIMLSAMTLVACTMNAHAV